MAIFDENFTFGTSRSPSLDSLSDSAPTRDTSRSVSPCSSPLSAFPPPRLSVTDLAVQFASHRIRRDAQIAYDSCASYAATDDDAGWHINDAPLFPRPRSQPPRPHSPTQRQQRQTNARLLCSSVSHQQQIADLVSRMVQKGEQCCVSSTDLARTCTIQPDDEGYGSEDTLERRESANQSRRTLDYRRASDLHSTGASVSKTTRFRKSSSRLDRCQREQDHQVPEKLVSTRPEEA